MRSLLKKLRSLLLSLALLLVPVSIGGLISEAEIPTDEATWKSCCDHTDCLQAPVSVQFKDGDKADVQIGRYPVFELDKKRVIESKNGKTYFCRYDVSRPPDGENARCVFYGRPSYVKTD